MSYTILIKMPSSNPHVTILSKKGEDEFLILNFNPNRSLGPTCLSNIKILGCSPKPKKRLPLVHSPHKT